MLAYVHVHVIKYQQTEKGLLFFENINNKIGYLTVYIVNLTVLDCWINLIVDS